MEFFAKFAQSKIKNTIRFFSLEKCFPRLSNNFVDIKTHFNSPNLRYLNLSKNKGKFRHYRRIHIKNRQKSSTPFINNDFKWRKYCTPKYFQFKTKRWMAKTENYQSYTKFGV